MKSFADITHSAAPVLGCWSTHFSPPLSSCAGFAGFVPGSARIGRGLRRYIRLLIRMSLCAIAFRSTDSSVWLPYVTMAEYLGSDYKGKELSRHQGQYNQRTWSQEKKRQGQGTVVCCCPARALLRSPKGWGQEKHG